MRIIFLLLPLSLLTLSVGHTSKLSKFMNKMDEKEQARQQQEWLQDMNFNDYSFRLVRRYTDERGQGCRDYEFRARYNPYRHGFYTVCDQH